MLVEPSIQMAEVERSRLARHGSVTAYDLYLRALPKLNAETESEHREAHALLTEALLLEPDSGPFLAAASRALGHRNAMGWPAIGPDDRDEVLSWRVGDLRNAAGDVQGDSALRRTAHSYREGLMTGEWRPSGRRSTRIPTACGVVISAGIAHLHCGDVAEGAGLSPSGTAAQSPRSFRAFPADRDRPCAHHSRRLRRGNRLGDPLARRQSDVRPDILNADRRQRHLGRLDEAHRLLAQFRSISPGVTIARIKAGQLKRPEPSSCNSQWLAACGPRRGLAEARWFDASRPASLETPIPVSGDPCPTTPSVIFSASPPGARATGRRSAASSTAARRASRSPRRRSSTGWTSASRASRASPPSAASRTRCASSPASSRTRTSGQLLTTGTPISLLIENVDAALQGLRRDQGQLPARPCRLHLRRQIRHPRLARQRPRVGARDGVARRRRRDRPQGRAGDDRPRRAGADGAARHRPHEVELGRGRRQPVLLARPGHRRRSGRDYLDEIRKSGSSVGAVIEVIAHGLPAGLGAPVYGKLDQDIASAMMSINAVKGVEIGAGFAAAALTGEENADEIRMGPDGSPDFLSNNAGGILGGISTGQPIVARFAVKPTSSILTPRRTDQPRRRGGRGLDQGPPRPLRRHPRRAGRRSDAGDRPRRPLSQPSRPGRLNRDTRE